MVRPGQHLLQFHLWALLRHIHNDHWRPDHSFLCVKEFYEAQFLYIIEMLWTTFPVDIEEIATDEKK